MFDVDARIINPETLSPLPQGEVGEIIVHAPQVMQGYWRQPEATAEAFLLPAGAPERPKRPGAAKTAKKAGAPRGGTGRRTQIVVK